MLLDRIYGEKVNVCVATGLWRILAKNYIGAYIPSHNQTNVYVLSIIHIFSMFHMKIFIKWACTKKYSHCKMIIISIEIQTRTIKEVRS